MEAYTFSHQPRPFGLLKEGMFKTNEEKKTETLEELQERILALENELKKQKQAAEKGTNLIKVMWGDQFETDSLH